MADEDWKHLKFYGYAPGGYLCRCGECGQQHEADKRAATCRSCAEKLHAEHREVCWTLIFFREGGFYPIDVLDPKACGKSLREQAAEHAAVNPGTQRVEDINGNVLWDAED